MTNLLVFIGGAVIGAGIVFGLIAYWLKDFRLYK